MLEFKKLVEERDNIMLNSLSDEQADFSNLREICKRFNERCVVQPVFKTDGTDQELWESVNTYFAQLLKKS